MERHYIRITDFCKSHYVEESFIYELFEYELISLEIVDEQKFIHEEELPQLEKMVRMYRDLNINPEGIDAIHHLLRKTLSMQEEINRLRRRLNRFEKP